MKFVFTSIIKFYQNFISPLTPSSCRFVPSCSEYTKQAIIKFGILKGGWLGIKRISKCHPFHEGGIDEVP
ncbi:MAG: membrane protein insertion efficiency factor YidD [Chlorobiota bacterium]|nr:membrane protein insertion efficiency factor YidD [Chlorobiota bacterium]QQS65493.1 MAG: membrane protein insertion efficiency factor YidD [Chlorobiota bacterium]